jgi:acyl carrier protein
MTVQQHLAAFIETTCLPAGERLRADEPLLTRGILDSLGILHLVAFIEEEYGLVVPEESWTPSHFGTVRHLAALVSQLQAA